MNGRRRIGTYSAVATAVALGLSLASCGGGGGGGDEEQPALVQSTIDSAGAMKAVQEAAVLLPICAMPTGNAPVVAAAPGYVGRWLAAIQGRVGRAGATKRALAVGTKPSDVFGDCGGRMTYPSYSYVNGITTATLLFDSYCTSDSSTGNHMTVNGSLSFVSTATPTASGSAAVAIQASSAGDITAVSTDAGGAVLSTQTTSFTNFALNSPGDTPTAASPLTLGLEEFKFTNTANETRRVTGLAATAFQPATGGLQVSVAGRVFRPSGEYIDLSTSIPIQLDSSLSAVAGQVTFAGAGGTNAVVTLVPGPVLQATVAVNGTPLTAGLPACQ